MRRTNLPAAVFSVLILISFNGCTIIGFAAGSDVDKEDAIYYPGSTDKLAGIKNDTPLEITLRNNYIITGTVQGIKNVDSAAYHQRYMTFQSKPEHQNLFPSINDTITLVKGTRHKNQADSTSYLFSGFDFAAIRYTSLADMEMKHLNLPDLFYITSQHNQKFYPHKFRMYLEKGLVPLASELIIQSPAGLETIPAENVKKIELLGAGSGKVIYTILGISLDVLFIFMIRNVHNNWTG